METITKVIVPQREPKFTPAGQRKRIIQLKALLFAALWEVFKNAKPAYIKAEFDQHVDKAMQKIGIVKNEHNDKVIQDALDELKRCVFFQPKNIGLLRELQSDGFDIMFGKDETLANKLVDLIKRHKQITSMEYIRNTLARAHSSFYAIGRERKWADQEIITPEFGRDNPVVNAGNPLTKSVRDDVKKEFDKMERPHKFNANITMEDGNDKQVSMEKHGLPASVAVIYYVIIHTTHKLLTSVQTINDTRRMINMAHLILLWTITLHEGARPGDTMSGTTHTDFVFRFGREYHMLTLAFVSAPTLAYLLGSNYLKRFRFESFKGKTVKEYRGRWHSWLPWEYNSIDLAFIYILMMRIIAFVDPSNIQKKVFNKPKSNLSDIRKNVNDMLGIKGLVMYSIRYALCEESLKYVGMIPGQWVKYVMGHVQHSFMRHRYAANASQRVSVENITTLLGGDVSSSITNDIIPIGFHPYNDDRMDKVPEDVPQDIINELDAVEKEVRLWLESSKDSIKDMDNLMSKVPKTHEEFFDDMSNIPFGSHFSFKTRMLSIDMETKLEKTLVDMREAFFEDKKVPTTTDKVVLWSYGQVMFGEWHKSNNESAKREYDRMQARQLIASIQQEIMKIDCGVKPQTMSGVKRLKDSDKPSIETKKPKVVIDNDDDSDFVEYSARQLEVNDVVFIKCSVRDKWSIKIPNTNYYVWVCHIQDVKIPKSKKATIQVCGNFYTGSLDELVYDVASAQPVKVCDDDLVYVMSSLDKDEIINLKLANDEMDEVFRYWHTKK
jgi:hypothetical protein